MTVLLAIVAACAALLLPLGRTSRSVSAQTEAAPAGAAASAAKPAHVGEQPAPGPMQFSHKFHLEMGASCTDCHDTSKERAERMPKMEACTNCHAVDPAQPGPDCVKCHTMSEGKPVPITWALHCAVPGVTFNHEIHTEAVGLDCKTCHVGIEESEKVSKALLPKMEFCINCHKERGREAISCAKCHTAEIGKAKPESHLEGDWVRWHGKMAVRGRAIPDKQDCRFCHAESYCSKCHQDMPPRNHTNQFRVRGHGLIAAMDREKCSTCHTQDSCVRCHQSTPPSTGPNAHTAGFGFAALRHCNSCHLTQNTCDTCHKGQPSHLSAPVPPPSVPQHFGAFGAPVDCRLCHRRGSGLVHPDNGTDCLTCHQRP